MKKNLFRVLAAAMALSMVLSLAACGNDDKGSSSSADSSSSSTTDSSAGEDSSESSAEESSTAADGKFATVKAFLEDPDTKAQLDTMIEQMVGDDDTMDVSIEGGDDTLTYIFKYSDEALGDTDVAALADALAEGMDSQSATFEGIASSIATVVEVENPKVVVTYAKADGTEIYSHEFTAK